jgi:hypothetical protein
LKRPRLLSDSFDRALNVRCLEGVKTYEADSRTGNRRSVLVYDELNGRGDHVHIRCGAILGATVRSEYLEMETC